MSGRNIEDFFQDTDAFDALSDEDRARLFAGESIQGETDAEPAKENSDTPAAVTVDPEVVTHPAEPEPVVLAKDGQHTIPFSELEAARERARQLEQELQALKTAPAPRPPEVKEQPIEAEIADLRRQYREAMYAGDNDMAEQLEAKIDAANDRRMDAKMAAREADAAAQEAGRKAKEAQESAVSEAQAKANALVAQYPFLDPEGPAANQDAIDLVVAQRDKLMAGGVPFADAIEQAVAKVAPLFDKGSATPQAADDVARKAAEAIAKAKTPVPNSLSEAPAGTKAYHDENEALRAMDINRLSQSFENKSPEEIMRIMAKAL